MITAILIILTGVGIPVLSCTMLYWLLCRDMDKHGPSDVELDPVLFALGIPVVRRRNRR